jgi:Signal transduction histidine kinase
MRTKGLKNLPEAEKYLEKGLSLSHNNPFLKAASHYYQAYYLLGNGDLNSISNYAHMADSQLTPFTYPEAYRIRSSNWLLLGVLEQLSGNEKKSIDIYINKVLPLAKKSGNTFSIANANKFIGIGLLNARERDKANTYLQAAWSGFEMATTESDALKQEAIVEVLLILAENDIFRDKLGEGKMYLDKAYAILKKYPGSNAFLFYYVPEGQYYEKKGQLQQAVVSYNKGIALQSSAGAIYYINRAKYLKFEVLRKQGRNQEAINVMQDLLKSKHLLLQDRGMYANLLARTYALTGNMAQAYEWSQNYITLSDSLQTAQNRADILEIEKKYETAEKEKQINSLKAEQKEAALQHKNQRLLNWLLGTGAIVCLLALLYMYSIYKNNKQRNTYKLKELQQQKKLQVTQAVLQGEEKERRRIARELHDGLGGTLAGIKIKLSGAQTGLPVIEETIIQLENSIGELRRIARNLMPETLIRSGLEIALRDLCAALATERTTLEYQSGNIDKI